MSRAPFSFTLTNCDRDPVHIPESIQPHGFLLAADAKTGVITHVSQNYPATGPVSALLGQPLAHTLLLDPQAQTLLTEIHQQSEVAPRPIVLQSNWQPQSSLPGSYQLLAHQRNGFVIVEGESTSSHVETGKEDSEHSRSLKPVLLRMTAASSLDELCALVVEETRRLTGFDRVLIYQFDEDWNGSVVAEDRNDVLPSYLRHRFPASDIPKPARDFYHVNRLRMIADATYTPVAIESIGTELPPLDLTHASLRGVSPVHLEYMRNMGTGCSMSVSLMLGGRLWGLLSCHGAASRRLSFEVRNTCDLLGHIFSLQLATREQTRHLARQVELRSILSRLLMGMTLEPDFIVGLNEPDLLRLADAHGAAILRGEEVHRFGRVPAAAPLLELREWLADKYQDGIYTTDRLSSLYPGSAADECFNGGLLAISISPAEKIHAFWFRAEMVQTILWGGDPHQGLSPTENVRLHPRRSFQSWTEIARERSARWEYPEIEAVSGFRRAVIDQVLQVTAEKALMTAELQRMNRELEAFSYTVSHDLRAPFRHVHGFAELLQLEKGEQLDEEGRHYLVRILSAARHAGQLVDTILAFSRMNLSSLNTEDVDLLRVATSEAAKLDALYPSREITWQIDPLPTLPGDSKLLQVALQHLLDNAVKYTARRADGCIRVRSEKSDKAWIISVEDNGVGFDMTYAEKLFGIFQRLHSSEDYPGLGIGLASVKRIIERHGGRVWAKGEIDHGATFYFSLPIHSGQGLSAPPSHVKANPAG